ncbi:MAG: hypothetical protein IJ800_05795 [Clostridia bacterium]|nr:hypothetical protein [Clostridia bacterium]
MKELLNIIKSVEGVDAYKIVEVRTISKELFFVGRKLETIRSTSVVDKSVSVYAKNGDGMGDSTFAVYQSMTDEAIREKTKQAVERAKLIRNKPYSLAEGGEEKYEIESNIKDFDFETLAFKIADAVFKADSYKNGSINALEIFVYQENKRVVNSEGVDKSQTSYRAMIEAIPTWTTEKESVELYEQYNFTDFNADEITAEIDGKMKEVRDREFAVKLAKTGNYVVTLRPQETCELIKELTYGLSYGAVYARANIFKLGDDMQEGSTGDKLGVTMRGKLKGSRYSSAFDGDGVTLKDVRVIDGGKVANYYGDNRFGQYLGKAKEEISGSLACVEVDTGSVKYDDIKNTPRVEVVSMSGIQVDIYNDYIGGEIRLAYYHEGDKVTPITGVSMSGRLSEVLKKVRFSDSSVIREEYKGPKFTVFEEMNVI